MKKCALFLAVLIVSLSACGKEEPPATTPFRPVEQGTGPIDATLSAETLALRDHEWFIVAEHRLSNVTGRVVDDAGRPIAGAAVGLLIPPPVPLAPSREARAVRTDADGVFRFTDVPRNALIRIKAEGSADRSLVATDLLKLGGDPVEVRLLPPGEIRGRLLTEADEPVAGVEIMVHAKEPAFASVVTTDAEGWFHFRSVPPVVLATRVLSRELASVPGKCLVRSGETTETELRVGRPMPLTVEVVDAESGRPIAGAVGSALYVREWCIQGDAEGRLVIEGSCYPWLWLRADGFEETPARIPADRTVAQTIRIPMSRGAAVRGRVIDVDGQPVADARVRAQFRGSEAGVPARGPVTAKDGTFEMSWIPAGQPRVGAIFAEKPGWYLKSPADVPLRKGRVASDATIVLDRLQRVTVRILGTDGTPVTGALVELAGIEPFRAGSFQTFVTRAEGLTEADGRLTLYGVAPQRSELSVQIPGRLIWRGDRDVDRAESFDLGDVRIPAGLAVSGRVESTSGKIPAGTSVSVATGDQGVDVPIREDGTFRCEGLPEGPVDLRVRAPGHRPLLQSAKAGDENVGLVLTAFSSIRVEIVRPGDVAILGWIELRPVGGNVHNRITTTRRLEGKVDAWTFPNLLAGTYRLRIQAGDWYARAEMKLAHGADAEVEMILEKGATILGTLRRPDGSQSAETGIGLIPGKDGQRLSVVTDGFGRFEFRGVPPGEVTLISHPTGFATSRRTLRAVAGETTETELALRAGGRIQVTVRDESGAVVPGVRVALGTSDAPARFWIEGGGSNLTSDKGAVTLTGVEPGDYGLSLFRSGVRRPWGKVSVTEGGTARVDVVWK